MFKRLLVLALVGAAGFAAWQAGHPAPVAAGDATGVEYNAETFGGRLKLKVGTIVTSVAGGQIRASVAKTERDLARLKPVIKRTRGPGQRRALAVAKKVTVLDSLALASLDAAHPMIALRQTMDARGFIGLIRQDIAEEVAAR